MPYIQTFYLTFKILRVVENKKHNQKAQIPQVILKRLVKKEPAFTKRVNTFNFDMAFVAQHSEFKVLN